GLRVLPPDLERLETSLESGLLDFAMGSYPGLPKRIRRQRLWSVAYTCAVRRDHPRIADKLSAAQFAAEKHVLVSAAGTGHSHEQAERAIEAAVPAENIVCRVPTFVTAAFAASKTDAIVTLPEGLASMFAEPLGLKLLPPPVKVPKIEVYQYWHERFHREPGNQWIRALFLELFAEPRANAD